MTAEKKESIVSRIKKLLALTEERGATKEEAASAAAKVQALLFEHNLEMSECTASQIVEDIDRYDNALGVPAGSPYNQPYRTLYSQICRYNFCKLINIGDGKVAIIGKKSNVEVCRYLYEYLSATLTGLANKAWKEYLSGFENSFYVKGNIRTFKASFVVGAAIEIGARLKAQQEQNQNASSACTALVVVSSQQLAIRVKQIFPRLVSGRGSKVRDGSGYAAGQAAGRTVSLSRGVTSSQSSRLRIGN